MEQTAGVKTSEFWVTIILSLLLIFGPKLGVEMDLETIIGVLTLGGIYTGARAYAKSGPNTLITEVKE